MTSDFFPPIFSRLFFFCCCNISAFACVQGPSTLAPSAITAPGALLVLQRWLAVSSGGPRPLLGGQAGCGVLLATWKSWCTYVLVV